MVGLVAHGQQSQWKVRLWGTTGEVLPPNLGFVRLDCKIPANVLGLFGII
jgi:hypothetical protein